VVHQPDPTAEASVATPNRLGGAAWVSGFLTVGALLFGGYAEAPSTPRMPRPFWVATDGQPENDGSRERPLDLTTALSASGPVAPGDTIWLRGGTYRGSFLSTVAGTASAPVIVRQEPGERATIDSADSGRDALTVMGPHSWFWGFEITSSDPRRQTARTGSWPDDLRRGYGSITRAEGTRYINLIVHDNANGLGIWSEAVGADAYGNLIYNNGWQGPDRAHGHGIYTQNTAGVRHLSDNVIFNQFSHGIHAYGSGAASLDDITLEGNIVFNNGAPAAGPEYERNLLLGGGRHAHRPKLIDNMTYFGSDKASGENNVGYDGGCSELEARGNYLVGGRALILRDCVIASFVGNTFVGVFDSSPRPPNNEYHESNPAGVRVFVRPNRCEPGRAHAAVYNWDAQPIVSLDLSAVSLVEGERFQVLDVQDYFGRPLVDGVFDGQAVQVPMMSLGFDPPVGNVASAVGHTGPRFAAFVIVQPDVAARTSSSLSAACPAPTDAVPLRNLWQWWTRVTGF